MMLISQENAGSITEDSGLQMTVPWRASWS